MFLKNKQKAQVSIEMLVIIGVLIIGVVIVGVFSISNLNKRTGQANDIISTTNTFGNDLNIDTVENRGSICGDGIIEGTEECEPGPPLNLDNKTCASEMFGSGTLGCYPVGHVNECDLNTSDC
jgi:hypothetical protein